MCRHRVMLVLSYQRAHAGGAPDDAAPGQEARWRPGDWLSELASLPGETRRRAQQLADKGLAIVLSCPPGGPPSAKLPMSDVRFYSRASMHFARCDCVAGSLCEHVALAVQAFAEAEQQQPGFTHLVWQTRSQKVAARGGPFDTAEGEACRQSVEQLSRLLWQEGISQPLIRFDAAFTRALRAAQGADWRWVTGTLTQLRHGVEAFQQRASHYPPLLQLLAGLESRLTSAGRMAQLADAGETPPLPWRAVVGLGVAGEASLDRLRLVSLGMRCWQDRQQYGLRIWFSDPDTGNILHLTRGWPLAEQAQSPAWTRRLFTFQAGSLAGGKIISRAARRRADGELALETRHRLSSCVPLTPDAWRQLPAPLRQPGVAALRDYLRQRPPACVRPLDQVDNLFILPVDGVIVQGWDAARQRLEARVYSGEGENNILPLSLAASASAPWAIERMAALLEQSDDPLVMVSGLVSASHGQLTLEPLVMMTATRAWVLDAEPQAVGPLPAALPSPQPDEASRCLGRCRALLIHILHNGLRYQQHAFFQDAQTLAADLAEYGFTHLARLLRQLHEKRADLPISTLNTLALLYLQLENRVPGAPV
jgi:hypothetical protein